MVLSQFTPQESSEQKLRLIYSFYKRLLAEREPGKAPSSYEAFVANVSNIPEYSEVQLWVMWSKAGDEVLGRANLVGSKTEGREDVLHFEIFVAPERRRQGIGTRLLTTVRDMACELEKRIIYSESNGLVPAGEAFLRRIGGEHLGEGHTNVLYLADLDRALMHAWLERARPLEAEFVLEWWQGPYPEDRLDDVVQMMEAYNLQPQLDTDVGDERFTVEQARQLNEMRQARGITAWTALVRERVSAAMAGYTEIFITKGRDQEVEQGLTVVFPQYRNKGIGRWLKAAMAEKVLAELPAVTTISTSNADVNAPMLKINSEMGFRPAISHAGWRLSLARIEEYLTSKGH